MKTFKVIAAVMLAVSMLTTSVFAAEFVPSIEYKEEPEIERVEKEYETPGRTLKIIPYSSIYLQDVIFEADALNVSVEAAEEMEETVRDRLAESGEELKKEMLRNVIVGFEEAWTQMTDGAPLENAIIHDIFEITLICSQIEDFVTNEWIKISFKVEGISYGDKFLILHKPTGSDKWVIEEYEIDENDVITMWLDNLSPFAIVIDSERAPTIAPDAPKSPQTGVSNPWDAVVPCSVGILFAVAVILNRKFRKNMVQ